MTGRRRAIHIGLDAIADPRQMRRGLHLPKLNGTVDAARWHLVTQHEGFEGPEPLVDGTATVGGVTAALHAAASELEAGDLIVVTYAGHGAQVPSENDDEADDETWELWDATLTDDEAGALLGAFKPGVRVVVVSDSCHSETVFKLRGPDFKTPVKDPAGMPVATISDMASDLVFLSACADDAVAFERGGWGVLTRALLSAWDDDRAVTWRGLFEQGAARVRREEPAQSPRLSATAGGKALLDRPAFAA